MKVTFISNFLNHHQIPFCNEMYKVLGNDFKFVATEKIPAERLNMGYKDFSRHCKYSINSYEDEKSYEESMKLANESDVVILGSAPNSFLVNRIEKNKLTFRYSERIFKNGRIRILDPRVLNSCYKTYIRYRNNKNIHMLCASSYTAKDMKFLKSFPNKMWKWGYFPEVKKYDLEKLLSIKNNNCLEILWVGRFLKWKNPKQAIKLAKLLKKDGYKFKMNFIGCGELENELKNLVNNLNLSEYIKFLGSMHPKQVREYMENSNIFLFTSNFKEGWGAVLNEAMNSGCAVVASQAAGATNFLIKDKKNGVIYKHNSINDLYNKVTELIENINLRNEISKNAYLTMINLWNAKVGVKRFIVMCEEILNNKNVKDLYEFGPCSKAE